MRGLAWFFLGLFVSAHGLAADADPAVFQGSFGDIPPTIAAEMKKHSWRDGCPVPLQGLAYVQVTHWGFDGQVHDGEIIVHRDLAGELVTIFWELFENKFPVERMRLIDVYKGSDEASMDDNNSSAFNCRWVTGKKGVFSKHSYGRALDINPLINPYVRGKSVEPKKGAKYLDRTIGAKGMIIAGDVCMQAFTRRGWTWGGAWRSLKDYQHFEKKK